MKISIIKYCFICAFLCGSFSGNAEAPVSTAYADSLFLSGNFSLAAMEYERVFFVSSYLFEKYSALLNKSYCYKNVNNFSDALSTLERINMEGLSDTLQYRIRYEKALNSYLDGKYNNAQSFIFEIKQHTKDSSFLNETLFLEILTESELQNWIKTDSLLRYYLVSNSIVIDSAELITLFKKPKLLNPKTAKLISYIIPGSGQIMSGHIFRGLTSIVFLSSTGAFTYLSLKNRFYFSGLTTGLGILQMFYTGGARYAYYLALRKNAEKINTYNNSIRNFLITCESPK